MNKLVVFLWAFVFLSCEVKKAQEPVEMWWPDTTEVKTDVVEVDTFDIDSTAIADIVFGISIKEFNSKKEAFLVDHPIIGDLRIQYLNGFFYNGQLAGIEIISEKQDIFKTGEYSRGWKTLYDKKYLNHYETSVKSIRVTDVCKSPIPSKSFDELVNDQFEELSYKSYYPLEFDNFFQALIQIDNAFKEINKAKSKELYRKMLDEISEVSLYSNNDILVPSPHQIRMRYYRMIRNEANDNVQKQNEIIRNSPSWSVVRIIYKPLGKRYKNEEKEKEKIKQLEDAQKEKAEMEMI